MDGDTTQTTEVPETATTLPAELAATQTALRAGGYQIDAVIGRGGMGEVVLARDPRIGRQVAIKRMLRTEPSADEVALFLREARIQAHLDHPSVVPVFELGYDAEGRPYFAMKRLTGQTLHALLEDRAATQKPLLRAFVDVCLAVDLAHAKHVIHCDLKPSNVMLGNYGEVYVLDWGIAQVLDAPAESGLAELSVLTRGVRGTPGYMAAEQLEGEVSAASDVYALGCILFEILVREPLQPRADTAPRVTSPAQRRPDTHVPPELDRLCTAAVAPFAQDRPSARALAEGVQKYLDGDRDLELRRSLSATEFEQARTAYAAGDHVIAIQAGGAALALDPTSRAAAALVGQLMLQPPDEPSPALRAELAAAEAHDVRRHARRAALAYLSVVPLLGLAILNGVESYPIVLGAFSIALLLSLFAWRLASRPDRSLAEMTLYAAGSAAFIGMLSRVAGPFTFVPAVACVVSTSLASYPIFARRGWLPIGLLTLGWMVPIGLELVGWSPQTWSVEAHGIVMYATALELHGATTSVLMFSICAVSIVVGGRLATNVASGHHEAKRQLVAQAWHLRQLLPPTDRAA